MLIERQGGGPAVSHKVILSLIDPVQLGLNGISYVLLSLSLKDQEYGEVRALLAIAYAAIAFSGAGFNASFAEDVKSRISRPKDSDQMLLHPALACIPASLLLGSAFIALSLSRISHSYTAILLQTIALTCIYFELAIINLCEHWFLATRKCLPAILVSALPAALRLISIALLIIFNFRSSKAILTAISVSSLLTQAAIFFGPTFREINRLYGGTKWTLLRPEVYFTELGKSLRAFDASVYSAVSFSLNSLIISLPLIWVSTNMDMASVSIWTNTSMAVKISCLPVLSYYTRNALMKYIGPPGRVSVNKQFSASKILPFVRPIIASSLFLACLMLLVSRPLIQEYLARVFVSPVLIKPLALLAVISIPSEILKVKFMMKSHSVLGVFINIFILFTQFLALSFCGSHTSLEFLVLVCAIPPIMITISSLAQALYSSTANPIKPSLR